jgi:hypothetical protein
MIYQSASLWKTNDEKAELRCKHFVLIQVPEFRPTGQAWPKEDLIDGLTMTQWRGVACTRFG